MLKFRVVTTKRRKYISHRLIEEKLEKQTTNKKPKCKRRQKRAEKRTQRQPKESK